MELVKAIKLIAETFSYVDAKDGVRLKSHATYKTADQDKFDKAMLVMRRHCKLPIGEIINMTKHEDGTWGYLNKT